MSSARNNLADNRASSDRHFATRGIDLCRRLAQDGSQFTARCPITFRSPTVPLQSIQAHQPFRLAAVLCDPRAFISSAESSRGPCVRPPAFVNASLSAGICRPEASSVRAATFAASCGRFLLASAAASSSSSPLRCSSALMSGDGSRVATTVRDEPAAHQSFGCRFGDSRRKNPKKAVHAIYRSSSNRGCESMMSKGKLPVQIPLEIPCCRGSRRRSF